MLVFAFFVFFFLSYFCTRLYLHSTNVFLLSDYSILRRLVFSSFSHWSRSLNSTCTFSALSLEAAFLLYFPNTIYVRYILSTCPCFFVSEIWKKRNISKQTGQQSQMEMASFLNGQNNSNNNHNNDTVGTDQWRPIDWDLSLLQGSLPTPSLQTTILYVLRKIFRLYIFRLKLHQTFIKNANIVTRIKTKMYKH